MLFRLRKLCAVDLGAYSIKTAVVTKKGKHLKCEVSSYPSPGHEKLEQGNVDDIVKALQEAAEKANISGEKVVSAVNSQRVITRQFIFPRMPKLDIEKAVRWEAEKLIPMSLDDMEIRYLILSEFLDEKEASTLKYNVLLIAVPKEIVMAYYEAFSRSKLKLTALDLPATALWQVFANYSNIESMGNKIIVDIGFKNTCFIVMNESTIFFARTLPVGAVNILNSIMNLGYSSEEARSLLYNTYHNENEKSFSNAKSYEARENILYSSGTGEIITEIKRTIDFYRLQSKAVLQPEVLIITGGLSKIRAIDTLFEQELRLGAEIGFPVLENEPIPVQYSVAVGLALRSEHL